MLKGWPWGSLFKKENLVAGCQHSRRARRAEGFLLNLVLLEIITFTQELRRPPHLAASLELFAGASSFLKRDPHGHVAQPANFKRLNSYQFSEYFYLTEPAETTEFFYLTFSEGSMDSVRNNSPIGGVFQPRRSTGGTCGPSRSSGKGPPINIEFHI
jgi:hypothetical protein